MERTTEEQRIIDLLVDDILTKNVSDVEVLPSVLVYIGDIHIDAMNGFNNHLREKKRKAIATKHAEKLLNDLKNLELI